MHEGGCDMGRLKGQLEQDSNVTLTGRGMCLPNSWGTYCYGPVQTPFHSLLDFLYVTPMFGSA